VSTRKPTVRNYFFDPATGDVTCGKSYGELSYNYSPVFSEEEPIGDVTREKMPGGGGSRRAKPEAADAERRTGPGDWIRIYETAATRIREDLQEKSGIKVGLSGEVSGEIRPLSRKPEPAADEDVIIAEKAGPAAISGEIFIRKIPAGSFDFSGSSLLGEAAPSRRGTYRKRSMPRLIPSKLEI
jgi:hypothetical protein